jgi:hypothetical protein
VGGHQGTVRSRGQGRARDRRPSRLWSVTRGMSWRCSECRRSRAATEKLGEHRGWAPTGGSPSRAPPSAPRAATTAASTRPGVPAAPSPLPVATSGAAPSAAADMDT